jgi:PAS domain S-box-containing protein
VGENYFELYKDQPQRSEYLRRALDGGEVSAVVPSPNGLLFDTRYSPRRNEAGKITGVIIVSTDVTEQVRAQAQVAHQAELLDRVSDAIFATDENFNLNAWNKGAEEIYGWKAEEVLGKNCDQILETIYIGSERSAILEKTREVGQYQGEVIQYTRDHTPIFLETKLTALKDENGRLAGYAAANRDITERKHIQAELAEVQRRLIDSVETERQHIARELHDGPMQELYGLAYEIEALRSAGSQEEVDRLADSLQAKLRQVTQTLRVTATELRPPTLAPFGLEKAIRSHAARFQENYPELKLHLDLDADGQILSERVRLALFRIYQQALANIVRHAQASRVMIQLKIDANEILLEVTDNGCGFEVPARWVEFARKGHLGLVGAQERAGAIGGSLEVVSTQGQGTTIRVCVPREQ